MLFESWRGHLPPGTDHGSRGRDDPEFRRFLESQLLWDRAIAEGVAETAVRHPRAVVAAMLGRGHVVYGWGVPHQLLALGRTAPLTLLPFDRQDDCATLAAGLADAVFGVAAPPPAAMPARPRLGVTLELAEGAVRIAEVAPGSIAERAGLRKGDVIVAVAGRRAGRPADVAGAVMRQAPGTWLPIEVQRGASRLEIVARFPPAPDES
jgi:membrane-associated protease RseP (regulator of RpoE activity)